MLDNRRQALTADVQGMTIAVWVNTLPRLQRGEPWYEIGVDDPDRRRARYPEPAGRHARLRGKPKGSLGELARTGLAHPGRSAPDTAASVMVRPGLPGEAVIDR
ncbi:hypothetical protein [Streptomyces sp. NPDC041003]|uniref:hypothetical protein n=1 Tax=Streptomyces sp. NPDC041003 TaxID=3155730 RepID=UPI0033C95D29